MEHFIISLLKTASKHNWQIRVSTKRKDSWWCPSKTLDRVTLPGRGLSTRKQQWNGIWMWFLEILSLKIRFVSYSESRIKLTKQKLFSADCFCSFLPKFQIFWREIVRSPILMALPSLCLDIAHNYFDCKAHLKNGCKSHNIYYQN